MKDKFKQTSFFSTVKRKLDIFKWQSKKPNREEPILLGIKSTRYVLLCYTKDHIYRMVIVEGHCTMARSSSLGANCSLVDTQV